MVNLEIKNTSNLVKLIIRHVLHQSIIMIEQTWVKQGSNPWKQIVLFSVNIDAWSKLNGSVSTIWYFYATLAALTPNRQCQKALNVKLSK